MNDPGTQAARKMALDVLDRFERRHTDSREILHDRISAVSAAGPKAAATDIVFGVLRNRFAIDMLVSRSAGLPGNRIRPAIRNVLRIGIYELVYVPATPEHAILNEAVKLARAAAGKKGAGFANAVLRNATRMIGRRSAPIANANPRRCIPHDVETGCEFTEDVLPDPQGDLAAHLADAYSLPRWLVGGWLRQFGPNDAHRICDASNRRPSLYLQPNALKTTAQDLASMLREGGIQCSTVAGGTMIRLETHAPVASLPGFHQGLFTVQDPTAAAVAQVLDPRPGQTLLDLCAAPGGKTVRLAQHMQDRGRILATDIDAKRLSLVRDNCLRLGITIVECIPWSDLDAALASTPHLDAVLVDVPCSNTGVLARRPEVRMRITPEAIRSLADVQAKLLDRAAASVSPGGRICYSTCSIEQSENTEVLHKFMQRCHDFRIARQTLTLPFIADDLSFDHDGGFAALLTQQQ